MQQEWSVNTEPSLHLYRTGQSRVYFLRRLASFNICRKLLHLFHQSVVASVLLYAVVCWGSSTRKKDSLRMDKVVRRASSVVGIEQESVVAAAERRTMDKLWL